MVQLIRPIADILQLGPLFNEKPIWSKIDEVTPDDATTEVVVDATAPLDIFAVTMGTATDPTHDLNHKLRFRIKNTDGVGSFTISLTGAGTQNVVFNHPITDTEYNTYDFNIPESTAAVLNGYYDNIRVNVSVNQATGFYHLTWLEIEIPDVGPPYTPPSRPAIDAELLTRGAHADLKTRGASADIIDSLS